MQSQNSGLSTGRKKLFIVLGIAFLSLIILLAVLPKHSTKSTKVDLDSGKYYDANSGETVSNPAGKGSDTFGTQSGEIARLSAWGAEGIRAFSGWG